MAAFAGGLTLCVRVSTPDGSVDHIVGTATGPLLCLTPADFIELVNLQKDPGFYWPDVLDEFNQFHHCNGREEIEADALHDHLLSSEGAHDWEYMGDQILGWAIRHVDQPTRLQVIDRVDKNLPTHPVAGLLSSRQQFLGALIAIRNFARRVDSPFAVHFDFAWHLADNATEHSFASLRARGAGYPPEYWDHAQQVVSLFEAIGCSAQCALGLAAISVADVFGGMGSWNDQGFDDVDERLYHHLSATLFTALNRYFETLASTTASPRTI